MIFSGFYYIVLKNMVVIGGNYMKSNLYIEYQEKQFDEKELVKKVKKVWTSNGKKVSDLTSMQVYIKPEENMGYCIFNDDIPGEFPLD